MFKYASLPAWIVIGGIVTLAVFVDPEQFLVSGGEPLPRWSAWVVLALFVVGAAWIWQFVRPLVRLALGPDYVEIWTLRARQRIFFEGIQDVRFRPGSARRLLEVNFRERTEFGRRTLFFSTEPDALESLQSRIRTER